jgi:hypothetical protein
LVSIGAGRLFGDIACGAMSAADVAGKEIVIRLRALPTGSLDGSFRLGPPSR